VALLRVINTPPRGIGRSTIARLVDHAGTRKTLLEAAREAGLIEGLPKRAAVAVARFVSLIDRLGLLHSAPVEEIITQVLDQSDYRKVLKDSEDPEDQERLANVEELLTAAREFGEQNPGPNQLESFLEQACLVNDTDAWETSNDRVTLMTMHAAKGLEFPVVFIIAVEEGLLPHERSRESPDQLEEERRLLFVAVTRAREELQLSMSRYREFRGQRRYTIPSQFLMELPHHELEATELIFAPTGKNPDGGMGDDSDAHHFSAGEETADTHAAADVDHDIEFNPAEFTSASNGPGPNEVPMTSSKLRLTTAAALAAGASAAANILALATTAPPISPDAFATGMVVQHPEYGLGKIIDLDGHGPKRTATVQFATAGTKKFVLLHSPLLPARREA
jgi:DNA helicase-2/ATP-dependent DNA helicase PcrA